MWFAKRHRCDLTQQTGVWPAASSWGRYSLDMRSSSVGAGAREMTSRLGEHAAWLDQESSVSIQIGNVFKPSVVNRSDIKDVEKFTIWWHSPPYNRAASETTTA
jgi:hypothetical protein